MKVHLGISEGGKPDKTLCEVTLKNPAIAFLFDEQAMGESLNLSSPNLCLKCKVIASDLTWNEGRATVWGLFEGEGKEKEA